VTEAAKDMLGEKGYDEVSERVRSRGRSDMVVDKLSEAILRSEFRTGDTAVIDVQDGQIILRPVAVPEMAVLKNSNIQ